MCGNGLILPIFFFGTFLIIAAIVLYRTLAKLLLKGFWKKWYIRRSVDVSIVGFFALIYSACSYEHVSSNLIADLLGPEGYNLMACTREFWNLNYLLVFEWFVNNFGTYVIFPPFSIVAIGFAIEKTKQHSKTVQVKKVRQE
jgi:hypothetical protein